MHMSHSISFVCGTELHSGCYLLLALFRSRSNDTQNVSGGTAAANIARVMVQNKCSSNGDGNNNSGVNRKSDSDNFHA